MQNTPPPKMFSSSPFPKTHLFLDRYCSISPAPTSEKLRHIGLYHGGKGMVGKG